MTGMSSAHAQPPSPLRAVRRPGASKNALNDIRRTFLAYFQAQDHIHLPSSSLVPEQDPSLLFTNSGMVQFKSIFTGLEQPAHPRAVTAQKCLRAGGKHNDLDNVGHTARHHTFFEMLGNFSFGDYFKTHAIELAWRLTTEEFALPRERLWISIHVDDDEAHALWKKIAGLPDSRILRIAGADNFWSMGDTGPCGPCSEIFFDHGESIPGGPPGSADAEGDRFTEIWNLVFMQFEQKADGTRIALPSPSIDTGMGLERMGAVLQGVHDNYDTDLFRSLIRASERESGVAARGGHVVAHRVIADHLRACGFLIADGILPDNEGRGYVLRRIMRRAMRHAFLLGVEEPLLWRLTPDLLAGMGEAYPELHRAGALIAETLKSEERRFRETLARGLTLLQEQSASLREGEKLPGEVAFRLYDTYGFPLDLTEDVLREQGRAVDVDGFEAAMARQQQASRARWSGSGDEGAERLWFSLRETIGGSEFLGYEQEEAETPITALVAGNRSVQEVASGRDVCLIAKQTPFYAEGGGQIGDRGVLVRDGEEIPITDTQMRAELIVHRLGTIDLQTPLRLGEKVTLRIDAARRRLVRANHSATHLLHEALRRVLGAHVAQKGSLVAAEHLRFDFSHGKPLTAEEISRIEDMVNERILENSAVETRIMSQEEALASGALALFGERYGERVRVLFMGRDEASQQRSDAYSVEFCGGTHVARLGDIGLFKIVSQSSVAAGVRRIEALTGAAARRHLLRFEEMTAEGAKLLKTAPDSLVERIGKLLDDKRRLEKSLENALKTPRGAAADSKHAQAQWETLPGGETFAAQTLQDTGGKDLLPLMDAIKKDIGSGVVALVGIMDDKARMVVGVTGDLTARIDARELARAGAAVLGGTGGGRKDMAQCGGGNVAAADAAIQAVRGRMLELTAQTEGKEA